MFRYFLVCTIFVLTQGQEDNKVLTGEYELKYVQVIIRSAEHSPSEPYFNISHNLNINLTLEDFSPYAYDQLYPKGKLRMYENGVDLKSRYSDFLTKTKNKNILALSYDFDPGKHGVLITKEGLKGKDYKDVENKIYKTSALDKTYQQALIDEIIYPADQIECPRYEAEMIKLSKSDAILLGENKEVLKEIDEIFGGYKTVESYFVLHEMYRMHIDAGKEMPKWFKKAQKELKILLGKYLANEVSTPMLKRLIGGRFASHLLKEVASIINGSAKKKMVLLCVSPHMLRGLMSVLGGEKGYKKPSMTYLDKYPEYGAMFVIEVYKKKSDKSYNFRMLYKNSKDKYNKLYVEGCSELCGFNKFERLLGSAVLTKEGLKKICEEDVDTPKQ